MVYVVANFLCKIAQKIYHNLTSSLRNLLMTTTSYFQNVVIAGWGQHFPQVVLNRSAKSSPPRRSRRLQTKPEVSKTHEEIAGDETAAFACPQDGFGRVFQRHSAFEKHLSSEKYTKSLEKRSLQHLAKIAYKL